LTNEFPAGNLPRMSGSSVRAVQRCYPQIYLACHVDHVRTKSNRHHLSAHDSSLLVHLDETRPTSPRELARHLGVSKSTLSAALKRLETLGHLTRHADANDRRQIELRLTALGADAMSETSVLDPKRVARVLARLSASEQKRALDGLALLARAACEDQASAPRRSRW
jgi:DNA-binding MarR family transcriptional regulator